MGAADFVIQPYKHATQSGVTPLAYHFEKPMVVTNVGGLPALVPNGKVGIVVEPTPAAIANGIIEFYQKGQLDFEEKKYKEALKNYQKAVEIDKNFAFAWDNIGLCNRYLENYEDAIVAYEKSIKINPKGLMPLQNLAIVYSYKKDYKNCFF